MVFKTHLTFCFLVNHSIIRSDNFDLVYKISPLSPFLLKGSIEERLKQLQDAHRDFGPGSQHFLSSKCGITYLKP